MIFAISVYVNENSPTWYSLNSIKFRINKAKS